MHIIKNYLKNKIITLKIQYSIMPSINTKIRLEGTKVTKNLYFNKKLCKIFFIFFNI